MTTIISNFSILIPIKTRSYPSSLNWKLLLCSLVLTPSPRISSLVADIFCLSVSDISEIMIDHCTCLPYTYVTAWCKGYILKNLVELYLRLLSPPQGLFKNTTKLQKVKSLLVNIYSFLSHNFDHNESSHTHPSQGFHRLDHRYSFFRR